MTECKQEVFEFQVHGVSRAAYAGKVSGAHGPTSRNASGLNLKEALAATRKRGAPELARISNPAMLAYHISMIGIRPLRCIGNVALRRVALRPAE